jgi:hypothetical protein
MIRKTDALQSLRPKAQWVLRDGELEWLDTEQTQPTEAEIQAEIARLQYLEGITQYQKDREYPPISDQLDQIYHEGIEAWKATIDAVKAAHPKVEPVEADLQAAVDTHVAEWLFNKQLQDYTTAVARLAQYQVALGRKEVTEMQDTEEQQVDDEGMPIYTEEGEPVYVQQEVVVVSAIEPVEPTVERTVYSEDDPMAEPTVETIENPLITQDNAERAAAQAVVDATPEAVVAAYQA